MRVQEGDLGRWSRIRRVLRPWKPQDGGRALTARATAYVHKTVGGDLATLKASQIFIGGMVVSLLALPGVSVVGTGVTSSASAQAPLQTRQAANYRSLSTAGPSTSEILDELTTATSTTTLTDDGLLEVQAYSTPVNFENSQGDWEQIDPTLTPSSTGPYAATSGGNEFSVEVPRDASETPVTLTGDFGFISLSLNGLDGSPEISDSTATYPDADPFGSVEYQVEANGVKESVVLDDVPDDPSPTLSYDLELGDGLTPSNTPKGVVITDAQNQEVALIPPATMFDAAPDAAYSSAITYEIEQSGPSEWDLTIAPDSDWLRDSNRTFPVTIDPSILTGTTALDCWLAEDAPGTSYCGAGPYLRVGRLGAGQTRRTLLKFDLSAIPATATVSSASVDLYLDSTKSTSNALTDYALFAAGEKFNSSATWNSSGASGPWSGGSPGSTAYGTIPLSGGTSGYKTFAGNLPNLVQSWVDGSRSNNGVVLKQSGSAVGNQLSFFSNSNQNPASKKPVFTVQYAWPSTADDDQSDPGEPAMTSYGVDEDLLSDVSGIAEQQGISVEEALNLYGWQDQFADIVADISEDYPTNFGWARVNEGGTASAELAFVGSAPSDIAQRTANLSAPLVIETDVVYSEVQREAMVSAAATQLDSDLPAGSEVSGSMDPDSNLLSFDIAMPSGSSGFSTSSQSNLQSAARNAAADEAPNAPPPTLVLNEAPNLSLEDELVRGGVKIGSRATGSACTSGFPVKVLGGGGYGIITADHCDNNMYTYSFETSTERSILAAASRRLNDAWGDIQYHAVTSDEDLGHSFYRKVGKIANFGTVKKPYYNMALCVMGRTTNGYKNGVRTCSTVMQTNSTRGDYHRLVQMFNYVTRPGDSGGPWFWHETGVGVHSGWRSSCGPCEDYSQFTPIYGRIVNRMNLIPWTD